MALVQGAHLNNSIPGTNTVSAPQEIFMMGERLTLLVRVHTCRGLSFCAYPTVGVGAYSCAMMPIKYLVKSTLS